MPTQTATLSIEHETHYRYSAAVDLAQHLAYLCPLADERQQVERHEVQIDPRPLHHSSADDVFGNRRMVFTVNVPHRALSVRASSRVRVTPRAVTAPSLAWEAVRERLRYCAGAAFEPAAEFTAPSPYVPRLAALRELALPSFTPGRPLAEAAIDLMGRIHAGFEYDSASTEVETPLAQVLQTRRGVCQDFSHLMIGALRMMGLAARYTSGYLLTTPPAGEVAMLRADASHAWLAAWCPRVDGSADWLELDPTNNAQPASSHVRLATGRDYGDVTPLRGVIRGGGEHRFEVRVRTERVS